jgi:nuclear pore complex protein Nup107
MLAGRLDDAMALAIDMDAAWRARMWSGGKPYGQTITSTTMMMITDDDDDIAKDGDDHQVTYESYGNPHRALWRSIMFALADDAEEQTDANYAAINALLSSNFKRAIDNEALRSWDKALYAALKCSLDRTEDLLLHYHNIHRRQASPPYPGVEHFEKERDHLNATSDFSQMDERTAIETIKAAPFEAMHPDDVVADAICRFILGRHTLHELLAECVRYLKDIQTDNGSAADYERVLRFITHVAVYLDLKLGVNHNDLSPLKDELIFLYLDHLSTREDLWYMSVLYATFLPSHLILNKLPALLLDTEGQHERQHIVGELQEFLPAQTVQDILCATVELSLDEPDRYADDLAPTGADKYKMRSIHWLCFDPEHLPEALIAANSLLRYFLLTGNKDESAIMLMDDILPPGLYVTIRDWPDESVRGKPPVANALMEFSSFSTYLEGMKHLAGWKKTMKAIIAAEPTQNEMLTLLDQHQLSDFDKDIARSQHNRNVVESNRDVCKKVVMAASKAQGELLQVLTHSGGLLNTMSDVMLDGEDQRVRRKQLAQLRLQLIPKTVQQYYDVCTKTAVTLFDSLNAVATAIGEEDLSPLDALREIDDGESEPDDDDADGANHRDAAASDLFLLRKASFSPLVWTQKALELLVHVQDDNTGLRTNIKSGDYMMMLHKLQRGALVMHEEYQHSMRAISAPLP